MSGAIRSLLLAICLLLALAACGNKGPLVLPDEEKKKTQVQG